jgi:hypothetical protein
VYDGEEAWRDLAAVFLHDGAPAHDGLLYVGGKDEAGLLDDLAGLPGRDRMVRTGQLRVLPLDRPDGRRSAFEGERHLATYRSESDRALAAGYRSLRVAVDLSPLAAGPADGPRLAAFELLVDALVDRAPLSALCGYDAAVVHRTATDDAALVHPLRNDGPHGPAGAVYADGPGRWRPSPPSPPPPTCTSTSPTSTSSTCGPRGRSSAWPGGSGPAAASCSTTRPRS